MELVSVQLTMTSADRDRASPHELDVLGPPDHVYELSPTLWRYAWRWALGHTYAQIAEELTVSKATVAWGISEVGNVIDRAIFQERMTCTRREFILRTWSYTFEFDNAA
jgi:hypothetical protein